MDITRKSHKPKWFVNQLIDILKLIPYKKLKSGIRSYLLAIASFADKEGNAWPLKSQIAAIMGCNPNNLDRYDRILKPLKILQIKKRYDRRNRMTRKYYKIDLNAVLNLSIDKNGSLEIGEIEIKSISSEIERHHNLRRDRHHNLGSSLYITTHEPAQLPMCAPKDIVQDEALDDQKLTNLINIKTGEIVIDMFEEFWASYPRKEKKKDTKDIWDRKKLNLIAMKIIMDVKNRQVNHLPWQNGRSFIPLPSSYLNAQRWNDEIITEEVSDAEPTPHKKSTRNESINQSRDDYLRSIGKK